MTMNSTPQSQLIHRIEILDRPWSHPDSEHLRQLQREEINATYGRTDSEPGTPPSADDISVFVVAYLSRDSESIPIACGGLRVISPAKDNDAPGDVEIKRMYVHRDYRGNPWSAAKAVLSTLEAKARENGWMRIVLETGSFQTAAIKFYQREGYVEIPKFGAYVQAEHSLCFGKRLEATREG